MVIPESSFGLRCEDWHTGNSDGSCHAVLLSRREVHSIIENIAGFDTEHLRPLVLAEVWQGPRPLHPGIPNNCGERVLFGNVNTAMQSGIFQFKLGPGGQVCAVGFGSD